MIKTNRFPVHRLAAVVAGAALAIGTPVAASASAGTGHFWGERGSWQQRDSSSKQSSGGGESCTIPSDADSDVLKTIEEVLDERDASSKVRLSAYEAAWVESHANNLDCGHSDSVGVFQQRPSAGWGSVDELTDVEYATNAYLDQAIPGEKNNPGRSAGQLAQSVQRSAYPDRYDEAEEKARDLMERAQD
ncbi:hypothetical protein ACF3NT_04735 [Naumannella halotolerans]|uniref:Uncharacterized protein n=1 Tax=Naumannella halotolerans TaxID=993414 RepID=A0A4R7J7W6_9ACTN|nr:hypothetical protein [Naumannella halotolerans]TDT33355.1 hypothetical protein CLV29_0966 [Naumannella halotolerans]